MAAAVGRDRYGSGVDEEREEIMEEYAEMAHQLELDIYVDQWVAEHTGADELPPGQAILLSTTIFGCMVMMDDPTLAETLAGEVNA